MKCKLTDDDLLKLGYHKNFYNEYIFKTYSRQFTCFIDLESREVSLVPDRAFKGDIDLSIIEKENII